MTEDLNTCVSKEYIQMAQKHIKRYSISLAIRKIQNKASRISALQELNFYIVAYPSYLIFLLCCVCVLNPFSHVWLFVTPWTAAHQALLSMGFSRQEYWSGLPCPPPGDLPNPGMKPASLTSPALAGGFFTTGATWEAPISLHMPQNALAITVTGYFSIFY